MTRPDPYSVDDPVFECPACGGRFDGPDARECPSCGSAMRNISVPRDE